MQDQSSRTTDELLRDVWAHMDEMVALQGGRDIEIGINLGRPKDTVDELGKFSLMLADASIDANYSNAPISILAVESGYLLATANLTYAKRMVGPVIKRGLCQKKPTSLWQMIL